MNDPRVRYYDSFEQDFVTSAEQNYHLPDDYEWVRTDLFSRILSVLIYALALIFSTVYCRLFLHVRIKGAKKLRQCVTQGAFVYTNHTQQVGDVFNPALACFPRRIYSLASPANLGIPMLGCILPYLGALPLASNVSGMKKLNRAIEQRLRKNACIVIYPEAHVWDWCTFIRPFPDTSFKYPVRLEKPVFCMTTTYQKRHFGKKPRITIYIDGPILPPHTSAADLRDSVRSCMEARARLSNCEYVKYVKR